MATDFHAIRREVWRGFVDGGVLERVELLRYFKPLLSDVMCWLTGKGFFAQERKTEWAGYEAKLSCSATGMLHQALGKRGWLNTIFDKVVEDQRIPLMSTYLEQVAERGNRLVDFAERAR